MLMILNKKAIYLILIHSTGKCQGKAFVKGRKQEFEIIMMYYWLDSIVGDDESYWNEYLEKALPALNHE